jgi:hypothetical protein
MNSGFGLRRRPSTLRSMATDLARSGADLAAMSTRSVSNLRMSTVDAILPRQFGVKP